MSDLNDFDRAIDVVVGGLSTDEKLGLRRDLITSLTEEGIAYVHVAAVAVGTGREQAKTVLGVSSIEFIKDTGFGEDPTAPDLVLRFVAPQDQYQVVIGLSEADLRAALDNAKSKQDEVRTS